MKIDLISYRLINRKNGFNCVHGGGFFVLSFEYCLKLLLMDKTEKNVSLSFTSFINFFSFFNFFRINNFIDY